MPDIVLKDNKKVEYVYRDVQSISVPTPGGIEMATFLATSSSPVGIIAPYAGNGSYLPDEWFVCNGQVLSRSDYSELFQVIGTTYGGGNGSTTFNLPDLRTRVIAGYSSNDISFSTLGKTGGEQTHTLTSTEMPSHTHSISSSGNHTHSISSSGSHTHSTDSKGDHTHTINSNGSHTHSVPAVPNSGASTTSLTWSTTAQNGNPNQITGSAGSHAHTETSAGSHSHSIASSGAHTHSITSSGGHAHTPANTGGGGSHNNLQPYITLNYIIKAK